MKETFKQYQEYLVEEYRQKLYQSLADKTFRGTKCKGWKKSYMKSDEYKQIVENAVEKSQEIRHILEASETNKIYKYFIKNEDAILYLLKNKKSVNKSTIDSYKVDKYLSEITFDTIVDKYESYKQKVLDRVYNYFSSEVIGFYEYYYEDDYYHNNYAKRRKVNLTIDTIEQFIELYDSCKYSYMFLAGCYYSLSYFKQRYKGQIKKLIPVELNNNNSRLRLEQKLWKKFEQKLNYPKLLIQELNNTFTTAKIINILKNNPNYTDVYDKLYDKAIVLSTLQESILNSIPDNYAVLFPETRKLHRHFILHIGPTNSGKTYEAINKLKQANSGVYLAPLRLLAYEQFDNLNKQGIPCDLLTGEESIEVPNANHIASTVEMLDTSKKYDVGVIDECQMISDRDRGDSWTTAIMALQAYEIHLCASTDAENILIKLITDCGDTYEVIHTERNTPLLYDNTFHSFPKDVREGDALIVFSRKDVHSVAATLKKRDIDCSMIYGALPYDVRHNEALKFTEGKTKVVVATDAIGMGLNMPIKRIVFLKTSKYDGTYFRELCASEVQQIAGRAGRFGIFDTGYFTKLNNDENFLNINKVYQSKLKNIDIATISMPKSLIDLDVSLSKIIEKWKDTVPKCEYIKANVDDELYLCSKIENLAVDKKHLLYDLVTIPFSLKENALEDIWFSLAKDVLNNDFEYDKYRKFMPKVNSSTSLSVLETSYHICDLLYCFNYKFFKSSEITTELSELKSLISKLTIQKLDKGAFEQRTCKYCGTPLPWNYRYGICSDCYSNRSNYLY